MGYGENAASYFLSYLSPLLPVQDKFRCDAGPLMDMDASGIPLPGASLPMAALRRGVVRFWLNSPVTNNHSQCWNGTTLSHCFPMSSEKLFLTTTNGRNAQNILMCGLTATRGSVPGPWSFGVLHRGTNP